MIMAKVKALTPFAGLVTMGIGEIRQIPDDIARDLIACGYAEEIETEAVSEVDEAPRKKGRGKK